MLKDSEELLHYFINFKIGYGGASGEINNEGRIMNILKDMDKNSDYFSLIDVLERVLINFYQPIYNELHKNTALEKDTQIKELLRKEGVSGIYVGVDTEDKLHNFWSGHQKLNSKSFSYSFDKPEQGFRDGLDGLEDYQLFG